MTSGGVSREAGGGSLTLESRPGHGTRLTEAAESAAASGAGLTVLTVAVAEPVGSGCCDIRSVYWNGVVHDMAERELVRARGILGPEIAAEFRLAVDRSLADAVAGEAERAGADVIVVPARRSWIPGSHGRWSRRVARRSGRPVHVAAAG